MGCWPLGGSSPVWGVAWACARVRARGGVRVRVRVLVRVRVRPWAWVVACPCVLAFAFACAPSVAMFPLGRAMLYSCVRARYMCLRSGRGSDVNVYNVRRGLRGFLFFQAGHSAHRTGLVVYAPLSPAWVAAEL